MSSSDDDSSRESADESQEVTNEQIEEPDPDTMRVLISTDNHLGYLESDPVRGMDSFAAFEEVLYLAKHHKADMILLGGDLFHHNKPSRRTLHKTMEILRRYTMGPDPVKIQVLSDPERDFRGAGTVNYEDPNYSVDMPIFSIHGNHDDPTRDGGTEMLAALDLLNVANLVNYFGRQDQVDKVEISPVLIQKGKTKIAMYGLGNLRDERLNRMWKNKKVHFLRPEATDDTEWFNVFVLHQNRDNMGRGSKNCIHESMIPSWMDLAIFGHEHESQPEATESVVGTFRITQPGSSVATSLTDGESHRKHCIVMDIRGSQFRLQPVPLTMVRSFVMHEVCLQDHEHLDAESPDVDAKVTKILTEVLHTQIYNAREKQKQLLKDAAAAKNYASNNIKYQMTSSTLPLVRLRVEHTGFSTLNNQRFGAKFVGKVANPTDILLFARNKKARATSSGPGGKKKSPAMNPLEDPLVPTEIEHVSVEDLVKENLEMSDQKLDILKQKDLALALEGFVDKMEANAIPEFTFNVLKQRQQQLMKQSEKEDEADQSMDKVESMEKDESMEQDKSFESHASSVHASSKRKRSLSLSDDDDLVDKENKRSKGRGTTKKPPARPTSSASRAKKSETIDVLTSEDEDQPSPPPPKKTSGRSTAASRSSKKAAPSRSGSGDIRQWTQSRSSQASPASTAAKRSRASSRKKPEPDSDHYESEDSENEIEVINTKPTKQSRSTRTTKSKVKYTEESDEEFMDESEEEKPKKKRSRATTKSPKATSRGRKATQSDSFDMDENWGSMSTRR